MTLNEVIKEVILEEKQKNLKIIYDIDVNLSPKEKPEDEVPELDQTTPPTEEPVTPEPAAPAANLSGAFESKKEKGKLLTEAVKYVQKIAGEASVPYEKAMNIQTINDLIEYLSGEEHEGMSKQTPVEKVLEKKKKVKAGKIISPAVQDIILVLSGVAGQASALGDLINKEDKIIISIMYGNNESDNIGLKINKNAGTEVASTTIVKDGEILPGQFDATLINKQILFYRNSLT
jgi:hypothetical protein